MFEVCKDVPFVKSLRIMLQKSETKRWKNLGLDDVYSDDEILAFYREHEDMCNLCLNICCTKEIFTDFHDGIWRPSNVDVLRAFSVDYKKILFLNGEYLSLGQVRDQLGVEAFRAAIFRTEGDAQRFEEALAMLIMEIAGKGVDGRVIRNMPEGCPTVKLSVVNTVAGMFSGVPKQHCDPEHQTYSVNIGFSTDLIGKIDIKNSGTWGNLQHGGSGRNFKFVKPDEATIKKVKGCVIAAGRDFKRTSYGN